MELSTALLENNNCLTTTTLEAVRDNGLSNKPVVHEQRLYHAVTVSNEPAKSLHNCYTNYIQCTWTKWFPNTWPTHIMRCPKESSGGWLLRGKNVMLCCRDNDTRITLYLDAMTYLISVISIHLSTLTWINQTYTCK